MTGGAFGNGDGEEYTSGTDLKGTYEPIWVSLSELETLNFKPRSIVEKSQLHIEKTAT
jgi:hypothetical protein